MYTIIVNNIFLEGKALKNHRILNWICFTVLLMALWFIMSEKTEPKFLIIGAVSSALISALCIRTLTFMGQKSWNYYFLPRTSLIRYILYFLWLLVQIAKSAFYVSEVALFRKSELDPSIAWFRADYDNPAASAMLANSITLTPGTITIDISEDGVYSVHALTKSLREGLLDGSMQAKVAWLYGEDINFEVLERRKQS